MRRGLTRTGRCRKQPHTAYTRTHSPTETQTTELVQALTEANREFSTALNLVRAGHSMDLETHTLFMRKRMVA